MIELQQARQLLEDYDREFGFTQCPKCEIPFDHWLPSEEVKKKWLQQYPLIYRQCDILDRA